MILENNYGASIKEDAKAFEVEVQMGIPVEDTEIGNVINLITRQREI